MNRPTGSFAVFAVAFMGFMDFVPLYAVYALLFQAEGLSESGISLLLAIWSVTGLVAEVPSGALADLMSRRLLLSVGSLLTGLAFASWLVVPTFIGFATGFVLWGLGGAVASGTWESLVYDELAQRGATDRYAGIIGAGESAGWIAAVASAALTTPLLAAGGYELVGWVSVSVMVLHSGLALTLPTPPRTGVDPEASAPDISVAEVATNDVTINSAVNDYAAMLRAGARGVAHDPPLRQAVIVLALLTGLLAFDEYLPLVAASTGVAVESVPLLMTLTFLAQAVAAALAGRAADLDDRWLRRLLAGGAVSVGVGAVTGHPVGFAAIAVGYAMANCVMIVADARLQDAIPGLARATITSIVGLGSELTAVAVVMSYAGGSLLFPIGIVVALNALPLLGVSALLGKRLF